jgi:hypothetical protein
MFYNVVGILGYEALVILKELSDCPIDVLSFRNPEKLHNRQIGYCLIYKLYHN